MQSRKIIKHPHHRKLPLPSLILKRFQINIQFLQHQMVLQKLSHFLHLTFDILKEPQIKNDLLKFDIVVQGCYQMAEILRLDLDLLIGFWLVVVLFFLFFDFYELLCVVRKFVEGFLFLFVLGLTFEFLDFSSEILYFLILALDLI